MRGFHGLAFGLTAVAFLSIGGCLTLSTTDNTGGAGGQGGFGETSSGTGLGTSGQPCLTVQDCPPVTTCTTMSCTNGSCKAGEVPPGTQCNGDKVCDGSGSCVECVYNSHCNGTNPTCKANECISCSDGEKNGDETGVDCGGFSCPPCAPTSGGGICRTVQFTVNNKNTTSKIINVCDPNIVLTPYSYNTGSCAGITSAAHWQNITTTRDTWCGKIDDRGEAAYLSKHLLDQKCYCKFYKLFIGIQECDENKNLIGTGSSH